MEFDIIEINGIFKVIKDNQVIFVSSNIVEVQNFINWKKKDNKKEGVCLSCLA
jgi:hypothetical protein